METAARPVVRDTERDGLNGVMPLMPVASLATDTARPSRKIEAVAPRAGR